VELSAYLHLSAGFTAAGRRFSTNFSRAFVSLWGLRGPCAVVVDVPHLVSLSLSFFFYFFVSSKAGVDFLLTHCSRLTRTCSPECMTK